MPRNQDVVGSFPVGYWAFILFLEGIRAILFLSIFLLIITNLSAIEEKTLDPSFLIRLKEAQLKPRPTFSWVFWL